MNLGTMRTAVRDLLNEDVAGFWTDAQLNRYLNMAQDRVNSIISTERQDFFTVSATFTTVANTRDYAFPTDCKYIRRLEVFDPTDQNAINKLDEIKFPRIEANGDWLFTQNGQPRRYIIRSSQFALEPIPDSAYSIRIYYDQVQPDLVNDADIPTSPIDFHDCLVYWAVILAKKQNAEDDAGVVAIFNVRKQELIETLINRGGEDSNTVEAYLQGII